jgi:hypothetical protein
MPRLLVPSRGLAARDVMVRAPLKLNLERSIRSMNWNLHDEQHFYNSTRELKGKCIPSIE